MKVDLEYLDALPGANEPANLGDWDESLQPGILKFTLTEPQSRFIDLTCANPLFIGGYGSGKTVIKCISAIQDLTQFQGANIALYDPTFDQIGLNTAPKLLDMLNELGLKHLYNKNNQIIYVIGYGKLIMRSMNNPERIIGYEVFRSHVDEIGVIHPNKVQDVWNKIVARNRQKIYIFDEDNRKVIDIKTKLPVTEQNRISGYGTPDDGFGFTYNMWGKDPAEGYEYVRAPTESNAANIPIDYIPSLYRIYPEGLVDAFIQGIWCNFTTGSVYYTFDREQHGTDIKIAEREQLHIGMDFNVYHMAAAICVLRKGKLYCVDEFVDLRDTPDMILAIKERYPEHNIIIYPDSTGKSTSSKDATKSDHSLLRSAGFKIKTRHNPLVRDRVTAVNAAFENKNLMINEATAPQIAEAVEQQTYNKQGVPDKTTGLDHRNDALGYVTYWFFSLRRPKLSTIGVRMI